MFESNSAQVADCNVASSEFLDDVLSGLAMSPRQISPRWFYDHRGSQLFEAITELPEYYPSRSERNILRARASDIAQATGAGRVVVEFGSGSSAKTPLLLSAVNPAAYVPIDISGDFLRESASAFARRFPKLPVIPVEGDFTQRLPLPESVMGQPCLGFFPGSTIGNLGVAAAVDLLRAMAQTLGPDAMLVLGVDLVKSADVLVPAYDDKQGITAQFNLNLLHRINRELAGSIPVEHFEHLALWNEAESRIEMHLRAACDVCFDVAGQSFRMAKGETVHTENSHKYTEQGLAVLLRAGHWAPIKTWTDDTNLFSVTVARVSSGHAYVQPSAQCNVAHIGTG